MKTLVLNTNEIITCEDRDAAFLRAFDALKAASAVMGRPVRVRVLMGEAAKSRLYYAKNRLRVREYQRKWSRRKKLKRSA